MTVRSRCLLAAALGLCLAIPAAGQEAPPSANQQIADNIADRLRLGGELRHYDIDVRFQDGTAELRGTVADHAQREQALRLAQGVPGVERVVDHLTAGDGAISQVQVAVPPAPLTAGQPAEPLPLYGAPAPAPCAGSGYAPPFAAAAAPCCGPCNGAPCNGGGYVGPAYPFPKIPLGWASVKLQWQDGYWWIGKTATKHDWWRYRYW